MADETTNHDEAAYIKRAKELVEELSPPIRGTEEEFCCAANIAYLFCRADSFRSGIEHQCDAVMRKWIAQNLYRLVVQARGEGYTSSRVETLYCQLRDAGDIRRGAPAMAWPLLLAYEECRDNPGHSLRGLVILSVFQGRLEHFLETHGVRPWGIPIYENGFAGLAKSRPYAEHIAIHNASMKNKQAMNDHQFGQLSAAGFGAAHIRQTVAGLFSRKPKGFVSIRKHQSMWPMIDSSMHLMRTCRWDDECSRQAVLVSMRQIAEFALDVRLPEDPADRTRLLEQTVANMKLYKLNTVDKCVLTAIGNLLIDCGIRKGRPLSERIPPIELAAMRGKAKEYQRYCNGLN